MRNSFRVVLRLEKRAMKIGIIGPAQSGKTTIFKILLQSAGIAGDIGMFKFMDSRIEKLSNIYSSKKKVYPETAFLDLGLEAGFTGKEYSKLNDIDLFICVANAFFSDEPKKDLEGYITDIVLSDLEAIQNRCARIEKDRLKIKTDVEGELKLLKKCQEALENSRPLRNIGLTRDESSRFSGFSFISMRPIIVAINLEEGKNEDNTKAIEDYCSSIGVRNIRFFGKTELELLELNPEDRDQFSKEMGSGYNFREGMARLICKELNLITFFTGGDKDTTGWHLESGLSVIEAAGKIHSDIKRGFIRAEVVNYEDFIKCEGSAQKVREAGLLKIEGKEYIVKDGDILNIRFNV
jgi:ribosome-binding ATPase YchF (GTP1/OBG family)